MVAVLLSLRFFIHRRSITSFRSSFTLPLGNTLRRLSHHLKKKLVHQNPLMWSCTIPKKIALYPSAVLRLPIAPRVLVVWSNRCWANHLDFRVHLVHPCHHVHLAFIIMAVIFHLHHLLYFRMSSNNLLLHPFFKCHQPSALKTHHVWRRRLLEEVIITSSNMDHLLWGSLIRQSWTCLVHPLHLQRWIHQTIRLSRYLPPLLQVKVIALPIQTAIKHWPHPLLKALVLHHPLPITRKTNTRHLRGSSVVFHCATTATSIITTTTYRASLKKNPKYKRMIKWMTYLKDLGSMLSSHVGGSIHFTLLSYAVYVWAARLSLWSFTIWPYWVWVQTSLTNVYIYHHLVYYYPFCLLLYLCIPAFIFVMTLFFYYSHVK